MGDAEILAVLTGLNRFHKIEDLDLSTVNPEISPEDTMFAEGQEDHYYNVGLSALKQILLSLSCAGREKSDIKAILDFPSGWGRELRFIRAYFPNAEITAGEIDERALRFCETRFGASSLVSSSDFDRVPATETFDLIWCGSLITHLSEDRSRKLLSFFSSLLNDDGVVSFTTQGRYSRYLLDSGKYTYNLGTAEIETLTRGYDLTGYGYVGYGGSGDYGLSMTRPSRIVGLLEEHEDMTIVSYNEKGYDNHQDVVTCLKRPVSHVPRRPWLDRWIAEMKGPVSPKEP